MSVPAITDLPPAAASGRVSQHRFPEPTDTELCLRCRSITRPDYWLERDIYGVVRPCVGVHR